LEARVRHAARLYKEGKVGLLIPTGGFGDHPPSEAEVMAHIRREEGMPESVLIPAPVKATVCSHSMIHRATVSKCCYDILFLPFDLIELHASGSTWRLRRLGPFLRAWWTRWPL
jgi:hypothetical protein